MRAIWLVLLMIALSGCCPWCGRKEYNEAKAKMAELCAKDGGNTVFSTVQLALGEKFTEEGYPPMYLFFESEGQLGENYLVKNIQKELLRHENGRIKLYCETYSVINKADGLVLGKATRYTLIDGYAIDGSGSGSETDCPSYGLDLKSLYKKIFIESN